MQDFIFYLQLGWEHIISTEALDHQLFVMVLVTAFSYVDFKKIFFLITSFTIGHSITLVLSILDVFRIPTAWVEFLIPLTIVIAALENILVKSYINSLVRFNYFLALFFGLIHGMGFANTARIMMADEQSLTIPLLGFNIGLELGQILVVGIFLCIGFIITSVCKVSRRDWSMFVSSGVFALALKMTLERIPS